MKTILRFFILSGMFTALLQAQFSYNEIYIVSPQYVKAVTIDQALVTVTPKGLSFEYGLYLTISSQGTGFPPADSFQVRGYFSLPTTAVVTDFWLWKDDSTIIKGVVDRRDRNDYGMKRPVPAILNKQSASMYLLDIDRMFGAKVKKIKITYRVPMVPAKGMMTATLPTHIPNVSPTPVKMTVLYWPNKDFPWARLGEIDNAFERTPRFDTVSQRQYYYGEIPAARMANEITLQAAGSINGGVSLKKFQSKASPAEGFYQVMFTPSTVLDIDTGVKTAFMFELDESKTVWSSPAYVAAVKSFILNNYTAKDSFTLIFSSDQITRAKASGWYGGDSASVYEAFNKVTLSMMQTGNNMTGLILNGLSFIKEQGGTGALWLVAGTDKLNDLDPANVALSAITNANTTGTPIYTIDLIYRNFAYTNTSLHPYYYEGNAFLYEKLATMTHSLFIPIRKNYYFGTFASLMNDVLMHARGKITSFDMVTRLENGVCAERLTNLLLSTGEISLGASVNQVGMFAGQFPFVLELAGTYKGRTISKKITIADSPEITFDSTIATEWAGRKLASMDERVVNHYPIGAALLDSVTKISLQYHLLSTCTAFIVKVPIDSVKPCSDCTDETKLLSVTDTKKAIVPSQDSLLFSYPNPFNASTVLKVRLPEGTVARDARFQIFNMLGQLVRSFDAAQLSADRYTLITWDGTNEQGKGAASGMYFVVLGTPSRSHTMKLMYLK